MKTYQKENEYSYTLGAFPTFELLKNRPDKATQIICHDKLIINDQINQLFELAKSKNIPVEFNSRTCEKLSPKENTFVIGVFDKYQDTLGQGNHILLDSPSDMGNLGTIMRTALGFNITNIAIVGLHADYFNPKVIRASMGSIFSHNIEIFDSYETYASRYGNACYPFMLNGKTKLQDLKVIEKPYTLIFGNESSGLPNSYNKIGHSIVIEHSNRIDSLNLPISVSIALYHFSTIR